MAGVNTGRLWTLRVLHPHWRQRKSYRREGFKELEERGNRRAGGEREWKSWRGGEREWKSWRRGERECFIFSWPRNLPLHPLHHLCPLLPSPSSLYLYFAHLSLPPLQACLCCLPKAHWRGTHPPNSTQTQLKRIYIYNQIVWYIK